MKDLIILGDDKCSRGTRVGSR